MQLQLPAQFVAACNAARGKDTPLNQEIFLSHQVPFSIGIDTYVDATPPLFPSDAPAALEHFAISDVDHAKTVLVSLPIKCAALKATPQVAGDMVTELPDLELIAADLALSSDGPLPQHELAYAGFLPDGSYSSRRSDHQYSGANPGLHRTQEYCRRELVFRGICSFHRSD